jgi:hypothetical protein
LVVGLRVAPSRGGGHLEVGFLTGDTGETVLVIEGVLVERQDVLSQVRVVARVIIGLKCEIMCRCVLLDFFFFNYFRLLVVFLICRRYFFLKL